MSEPSRKLSTEEVNALMEGLRSGDLSTSTSLKDASTIEYKAFNFGSDDLTLLGDYYALRLPVPEFLLNFVDFYRVFTIMVTKLGQMRHWV